MTLNSKTLHVITRFSLRMLVLCVFSAFGNPGFGRSLAALLWMSTIFSAVVGTVRREPLFDATLNHWDETVAYAALCCLAVAFHHAAAL